MLIQEKKRLVAAGSDLRLLITNPFVRKVVELAGIDDMFQIDESLHPIEGEPPTPERLASF